MSEGRRRIRCERSLGEILGGGGAEYGSWGRSVNERPYRDLYTLRLRRLLSAGCGTTRRFVVTHQLLEVTADINGGTASSENVEIDRSGHNRDQFSAMQRPSNGACAPLSIRPICAIGSASTPAACNGGSRLNEA